MILTNPPQLYSREYATIIEIEEWCEETFKDKPSFLRRMPRQLTDKDIAQNIENEREARLGKKLNYFRQSSLYKKFLANGKTGLNEEEVLTIEKYEELINNYEYSKLNQHGENLLKIEEWCRENFKGQPKYLRRTPRATNKGENCEEERKLGNALSKFKSSSIYEKYQTYGIEALNEGERELIKKYEQIINEYGYGSLNVQGTHLLEIERWCRENFEGQPKYLRRIPRAIVKGENGKEEKKLGDILSKLRNSPLYEKYQTYGIEALNEGERELIEKCNEILQEYDYGYLNAVGENMLETELWCKEFFTLPRTTIKNVKVSKKMKKRQRNKER